MGVLGTVGGSSYQTFLDIFFSLNLLNQETSQLVCMQYKISPDGIRFNNQMVRA